MNVATLTPGSGKPRPQAGDGHSWFWHLLHAAGMDNNTALWLSKMANPWTLTGPQVRLSTPEYDWETVGYKVNEGPAVLALALERGRAVRLVHVRDLV